MRGRAINGWIAATLVAGWYVALTMLERRRPLRPHVEPKLRRQARNLTVGAIGAVAISVAETPLVQPLTHLVERRRWGLLGKLRPPVWIEIPAALILMDYTFYIWHVLTHRVPILWRFHMVHHLDLDLDASTAIRFHFGELIASAPWRAAQVLFIGMTPRTFSIWQTAFLLAILFHHSEMTLPISLERWLVKYVVTPRMHGIHHSVIPDETNSNWSSGLTIWDRLHGTLKPDGLRSDVTIGVDGYRNPKDLTLSNILAIAFRPAQSSRTVG